jgi:uncharacterized protein YecE (DUF72 family)
VREWRAQVPDTFRFAVKAPRKITHSKRLADCADDLRYLLGIVAELTPCLGSILFQLPPFAKIDVPRLTQFVALLPADVPIAFEFRNDSWFDPAVFELLAARDMALVMSETDDTSPAALPWTAGWGYLRLRKTQYSDAELDAWRTRVRSANLREAQVFFKHEDEAVGPKLAEDFLKGYSDESVA